MKLKYVALSVLVGLAVAGIAYAATPGGLTVPQGGTGNTAYTPGSLLYGGSSLRLAEVATGTITCSGCTASAGSYVIGNNLTITVSGASYPFTTATNFGTTTSATSTPLWLQGNAFSLFASSTSVLDYASSTALSVTGTLYNSALTATRVPFITTGGAFTDSANLTWGTTANNLSFTYGTTTQLSIGNGAVATPAIAFTGDPDTGIYYNTTNTIGISGGGAGISWNGSSFFPNTDSARNLGIDSTNRWLRLFTVNASTTALTATGFFAAPNQSTSPTNTTAGSIVVNTNGNASSSIAIGDGSTTHNIFAVRSAGFLVASSTLAYMGAFGAAGTTTLLLSNPIHGTTMRSVYCKTDVGTVWVAFGTGSATTTATQCTSAGALTALAANNTWLGRQNLYVDIGFSASSPNKITVTAEVEDTN